MSGQVRTGHTTCPQLQFTLPCSDIAIDPPHLAAALPEALTEPPISSDILLDATSHAICLEQIYFHQIIYIWRFRNSE